MPADDADDVLRSRLAEIAEAAGRAARMPATGTVRRRPARRVRRAVVGACLVVGAAAAPAAVGAGLPGLPARQDGPVGSSAGPGTDPPAGSLAPAAPSVPGPLPSGQPSAAPPAPGTPAPGGSEGAPSPAPGTGPAATPAPSTGTATPAAIWLSDRQDRDRAGCARPVKVPRKPETDSPALQALRKVLIGPGPLESARGYLSGPGLAGLAVRSLRVEGGTAIVDFDVLPPAAVLPAKPCRVVEILQPMNLTLVQFDHIAATRYSIRGSRTAFYRDLLGVDVPA